MQSNYIYSEDYIQLVLGMQIPLHESRADKLLFRQRVLEEHRAFEQAMTLNENFLKGFGKSYTKVKKFTKVLKTVMKDPLKITILIDNLAEQLKEIGKKIFNFADGGAGILGLLRSLLAPAKTKFNELFSTGLKNLEASLKWMKLQVSKGIKGFKELEGWKKAILGIALCVGLKELYSLIKNYYEKPFEATAEAIATWTDDDSVLLAFQNSKVLDSLEEAEEEPKYEDREYNPETHVLLRLTDGKPFLIEKKFWNSPEFKKIVSASAEAFGVFLGKKFEKFATAAILHATTGGWSTVVKLIVVSWKTSKTLGGVLDKALDGFIKDEAAVEEEMSSVVRDIEALEESLRAIIRGELLRSNYPLHS